MDIRNKFVCGGLIFFRHRSTNGLAFRLLPLLSTMLKLGEGDALGKYRRSRLAYVLRSRNRGRSLRLRDLQALKSRSFRGNSPGILLAAQYHTLTLEVSPKSWNDCLTISSWSRVPISVNTTSFILESSLHKSFTDSHYVFLYQLPNPFCSAAILATIIRYILMIPWERGTELAVDI